MDPRLRKVAETCLEGAESGAMTFPQIVSKATPSTSAAVTQVVGRGGSTASN